MLWFCQALNALFNYINGEDEQRRFNVSSTNSKYCKLVIYSSFASDVWFLREEAISSQCSKHIYDKIVE